jgi:hypothetical protein
MKAKFGKGVSMEGWRSISLASMFALDGFVTRDALLFVIKLHLFSVKVMQPLSAADVDSLQTTARELVREGHKVLGEAWEGKPNVHGLLELPWHTLAALRSCRFSDTRRFESRNKMVKGFAQGSKSGRGGAGGESNALKWDARLTAHRGMQLGLSWGVQGEYSLCPSLVGFRDNRAGREHHPHPELRKLTRLLPSALLARPVGDQGEESVLLDQETWVVEEKRPQAVAKRGPVLEFAVAAVNNYYDLPGGVVESGDIHSLFLVNKIGTNPESLDEQGERAHRVEYICSSDHVACWWRKNSEEDKARHFCRVKTFVVVRARNHSLLFVVPQWYTELAGRNRRMHSLRSTRLMEKMDWGDVGMCFQWFPASSVIQAVSMVHSCIRGDGRKACVTAQYCRAHDCPVTNTRPCPDCGRGGATIVRDDHCDGNKIYEVVDTDIGFVARTELGRLYAEDEDN